MFGIMNLFSRSLGGLASDWAAKRFGMRGRLWALFLLQVRSSSHCLSTSVQSTEHVSFQQPAPEANCLHGQPLQAHQLCATPHVTSAMCSTAMLSHVTLHHCVQICQGCFCIGLGLANNTFPGTVVLIIIFSLFVQSCEGATYAIVPFISKRALGAVNGIVGAGGDFGSVLTQIIFFRCASDSCKTSAHSRLPVNLLTGLSYEQCPALCTPLWPRLCPDGRATAYACAAGLATTRPTWGLCTWAS